MKMEKSTFCKKRNIVLIVFIFLIFSSSTMLNIVNASVDEQTPNITTNTSTWWDSNWNYRKRIELFHLDSLSDYQVLIELPVADYIGKTQSDGADIRFVLNDQTTVLDHWIEVWDESGVTNKVWVKIDIDTPMMPIGFIATFYLYYGNSAAVSTSNGDNVFEFFEDFSGTSLDTTKWFVSEYTGGGHSLSVANGELHIYADCSAIELSGYYLRTNEVFNLDNFALHAEARVANMDYYRGCAHIGDFYLVDDDNQRTGLAVGDYGDYQISRFQYTDHSFVKYGISPNTGTGEIITDYKVIGSSWDMDISGGTWSMSYDPTISTFTRPFRIESYNYLQYWTNYVKMDVYYDIIYLRNYDSTEPVYHFSDEEVEEQLVNTVDIIDSFIYDDGSGREYDKGEKVQVFVRAKNNLLIPKTITRISWAVESIEAETFASSLHLPYSNATGVTYNKGIVLVGENTYSKTLLPGESWTFSVYIDYEGYSNGALNIGEWKIRFMKIRDSDGATVLETLSINDFYVKMKDRNEGLHSIFIYYLWNSGGSGETFEGNDPKNYFEDGSGICQGGLFRFKDPNIVPVTFNMTISYNNPTWDIPTTGLDDESDVKAHGMAKAALDLDLYDGKWWESDYTSLRNCGFDVLMMGAARDFTGWDARMGVSSQHVYCFFKSGASTTPTFFHRNIDGCVQHQFSNFFQAVQSDDHFAATWCINNWYIWLLYDGLHEVNLKGYNPQVMHSFCDDCYEKIDENWAWFYHVTI
ncbi:MAG: DUF2341 domain-containing protein [Candidatus Heimdallarchaeota archaeon]